VGRASGEPTIIAWWGSPEARPTLQKAPGKENAGGKKEPKLRPGGRGKTNPIEAWVPRVRYSDPVRFGPFRPHWVGVPNPWHPPLVPTPRFPGAEEPGGIDAERRRRHSHAERGNEFSQSSRWKKRTQSPTPPPCEDEANRFLTLTPASIKVIVPSLPEVQENPLGDSRLSRTLSCRRPIPNTLFPRKPTIQGPGRLPRVTVRVTSLPSRLTTISTLSPGLLRPRESV